MNKKSGKIIKAVLIIALIVTLIVLTASLLSSQNKPDEINYVGELTSKILSGEIAELYHVGTNNVRILYTNSKIDAKNFPKRYDAVAYSTGRTAFFELGKEIVGLQNVIGKIKADNPDITPAQIKEILYKDYPEYAQIIPGDGTTFDVEKFSKTQVKFRGDDLNSDNSSWVSLIFPIVATVVMGILLFIMFRQMAGSNGKAMNFGKNKAKLMSNVKVRFTDVAGAEEEKEELQEVVEFLKNPKKFSELGARIPKGVLLVGPPGTGKTLFAKAVAGEAGVPFFSMSGSDFVEMFVGTGAARVRDLFAEAEKNMPCIVFIDEIDAVGRQRGAGLGGGNDEREQTLNQLLVQMDGFEKNEGIIIMAATNRADVLDPALLRPGRFDRQIYVNIPDVKGREEIFKVHSRNKPLGPDVSFKVLARMTSGFSGADIENLLNEAAILAARANRRVIIMEDILEGINKVIAGPQKKSRTITETDKRITAYHEAGHAIIARVLPGCDEVQEVSIVPRGMAAGYTLTRPVNDDSHVTKNKLNDMISMMLGGRAAEQIVIHDISTGASNDIERASGIARKMVTEWGMSDRLGNMFLGGSGEVFLGRDYSQHTAYSENIAGQIDEEVKFIIDDNYQRALQILKDNRNILDNMVKVLYEKNTIYTEEVDMLFDNKSAEEIIKAIDEKIAKREEYKKLENQQDNQNNKSEVIPTIKEEVTATTTDKENNVENGDGVVGHWFKKID